MTIVTVRVPAKINLSLGVGPVRDDGYHPLATVYQAVDLYDEVRASLTDGHIDVDVHIEANRLKEAAVVPLGSDNIAVQAAMALQDAYGVTAGVHLAIRKVIPVAGGMAGGSADAAATLLACNDLWGLGLSREELEIFAADLGSDVPFSLRGGNAVGGGRGEILTPVLARGSYQWVLAFSSEGLSTAAVYAEFDRLNADREVPQPEASKEVLAALRSGDDVALGRALSNDLTAASLSLRPDLQQTIDIGYDVDALGTIISGSGPTVAFLASDEQHALDISFALASSGVAVDVVSARGPVAGARII